MERVNRDEKKIICTNWIDSSFCKRIRADVRIYIKSSQTNKIKSNFFLDSNVCCVNI